jgi:ABC-type sugar transport system ATPase subunit
VNKESTILSGEELTKAFGSNVAVSRVSVKVSSGEIVALVGSNGSGKSTLLKMIYGSLIPDSGRVTLNGVSLKQGDTHEARARGIEMVFQDKDEESKLCPNISVVENLFLGREPISRLGIIQRRQMQSKANQLVEHYALSLPPLNATVGHLSGGQQKAVAIGRALLSAPRMLLLDEPTASLGVTERRLVHKAISDLKASGVGIILCSHSLEEVIYVSDRVIALRLGELFADERLAALSESDIALLMSK